MIVITICTLFLLPFGFRSPSWFDAAALALAGIGNGVAQYWWTRALTLAPPSAVVPFNYLSLVWASFLGFAIWGAICRRRICSSAPRSSSAPGPLPPRMARDAAAAGATRPAPASPVVIRGAAWLDPEPMFSRQLSLSQRRQKRGPIRVQAGFQAMTQRTRARSTMLARSGLFGRTGFVALSHKSFFCVSGLMLFQARMFDTVCWGIGIPNVGSRRRTSARHRREAG